MISCSRRRFASVASSFRSASFFWDLYFVIPAASSKIARRSSGSAAQDQIDLPLLHDRVSAPTHAGIHEQLVDVLEPAGRLVEQVFAFPIAKNAPGDAHFVPVDARAPPRIRRMSSKLPPSRAPPAVGAAENHVRHFPSAQRFGRLLAEHPAHRIENVRLAAAVGSDNRSDAAVKIQHRLAARTI